MIHGSAGCRTPQRAASIHPGDAPGRPAALRAGGSRLSHISCHGAVPGC
ncbi:hypothetical protein A176_003274 [Myxococcus hansupus]|uniref:Uncharacterized protein n=1 Tax=Pseudomyxococcus hansupus TaxID=1297742 RepID=A0A0H4XE57_9BACT|nr:hypothetical protein A176_003274 [Myxococcus hansupus]